MGDGRGPPGDGAVSLACLVTGTDTEVGKTFVASLIVRGLLAQGVDAACVKPVETGCRREGNLLVPTDGSIYHEIVRHRGVPLDEVCPWRFGEPVSPNIAVRESGAPLHAEDLVSFVTRWKEKVSALFVEGAGGLLVEAVDGFTFADLARECKLSVLVVAPDRLGVLNHVALTVAFLRAASLPLKGIVLNDVSGCETAASRRNYSELKRKYGSLLLGRVPFGAQKAPSEILEEFL
ncbi:MAG: dethiobiotin synthase [Deltaproteobacteria bacterium]|nr:MAG: dethiobiotin synthase [Deltaproteobacteria bacterium]